MIQWFFITSNLLNISDEDDDGFTCSIRTSALDLLLCVAKDFMSVLLPPLLEYVAKSSGAGVDWQQKESAYYIIGSISEGFDEETMAKWMGLIIF